MTEQSKQLEVRERRRKNIEDKPKYILGSVLIKSKKDNKVYEVLSEYGQTLVQRGSFEYYTKKEWRRYLKHKDKKPAELGHGNRRTRRGYNKYQEGNRFQKIQSILYAPKDEKGKVLVPGKDTYTEEITVKVAKFKYEPWIDTFRDGTTRQRLNSDGEPLQKKIFLGLKDETITVTKKVRFLRKTIVQYNYNPYISFKINEVKTAWKKQEEERKKKKEEEEKKTKPKTKKAEKAPKDAV